MENCLAHFPADQVKDIVLEINSLTVLAAHPCVLQQGPWVLCAQCERR